jgi:hypothetical protein
MASPIRALDRLKKTANLVPVKKTVTLSDGSEFEFYAAPLTMADREKARTNAGTDEAMAFAMQVMLLKAQDENGQRLFQSGEIAELKNEVRDEDVQKLILAVLTNEEEADPKK